MESVYTERSMYLSCIRTMSIGFDRWSNSGFWQHIPVAGEVPHPGSQNHTPERARLFAPFRFFHLSFFPAASNHAEKIKGRARDRSDPVPSQLPAYSILCCLFSVRLICELQSWYVVIPQIKIYRQYPIHSQSSISPQQGFDSCAWVGSCQDK